MAEQDAKASGRHCLQWPLRLHLSLYHLRKPIVAVLDSTKDSVDLALEGDTLSIEGSAPCLDGFSGHATVPTWM
jgi:hypothetical protein